MGKRRMESWYEAHMGVKMYHMSRVDFRRKQENNENSSSCSALQVPPKNDTLSLSSTIRWLDDALSDQSPSLFIL
jgi:hypothetical protein